MKILFLNCRGLVNLTKKSPLKSLITVHNPDTIFLQETMGTDEIVTRALEALLLGWSFVTIDAKGHSGGLATGWRLKSGKCDKVWGFNTGIDLNLFLVELMRTLVLINVYGPYVDRK